MDKPIAHQPVAQAHMLPTAALLRPTGLTGRCSDKKCYARRLRTLAPALVALVALAALLIWLLCPSLSLGTGQLATDAGTTLGKRQSTNDDPSFVKNKLYLIVVFVGLVVCVILAIMLSAWCCRGAFENPLCCPCYLCACCGGLACLECIGCGLCCEGLDQLDV